MRVVLRLIRLFLALTLSISFHGFSPVISSHGQENPGVDMLQWNIQVGADDLLVIHEIQEPFGYPRRMAVEHPYPSETLHLQKLFQEILQRPPLLQILSIHGGILGNQVNLFNTVVRHPLCFSDKRIHSPLLKGPLSLGMMQ